MFRLRAQVAGLQNRIHDMETAFKRIALGEDGAAVAAAANGENNSDDDVPTLEASSSFSSASSASSSSSSSPLSSSGPPSSFSSTFNKVDDEYFGGYSTRDIHELMLRDKGIIGTT